MLSARCYQAEQVLWWFRAYFFLRVCGLFLFMCIWFYFPVRLESSLIYFFIQCPLRVTCLPPKAKHLWLCCFSVWLRTYRDTGTIWFRTLKNVFHNILNSEVKVWSFWGKASYSDVVSGPGSKVRPVREEWIWIRCPRSSPSHVTIPGLVSSWKHGWAWS